MPKPAPIPLYHYTITVTDGSTRECDAMQATYDGAWIHFETPTGTVLSLRTDSVQEFQRSPEPVAHQEIDQL